MRIAILVHSLRRGGAERVVLELALGLKGRGHEVTVISWLDKNEYTEERYCSIAWCFLLPKDEYRWIRSIARSAVILRRILSNIKPDVIAIHTPNIAWVAAWVGKMAPSVHALHGYGDITNVSGLKPQLTRFFSRLAGWRLDMRYIVVSNALASAASAYFGLPQKYFQCVSNGIDLVKFSFTLRDSFQYPIILMVGTLNDNKGQALGIQAFKLVKALMPHAKLQIAGDGPMRDCLVAMVKEEKLSEHITFLGMQQNIPGLLSASHILWQLSKTEAMPMTVLEAMATGLPVVGFDVRGIRDAISNGETGELVPYGNLDILAKVTVELLDDLQRYQCYAVQARARVERYFSLCSMVEGHESILNNIIGDAL